MSATFRTAFLSSAAVLLLLGSGIASAQTAPPASSTVEAPASEASVDAAKLLATQPLPDIVIGQADAPVTIIEYASMTCSHCRDFHSEAWPAIKRDYVDTGKAKVILREFPFDPRALAAFMLARCAGDDKRSAMVDVLFDQQREWAAAENASVALLKIAQLSGMSQDQFKACLSNSELQSQIVAVQAAGQNEFGVSATPTFFVNGEKYSGALSPEQMGAVIEKHL